MYAARQHDTRLHADLPDNARNACVVHPHRTHMSCLETTLPLPQANEVNRTVHAGLSRRKDCMLHGRALPAIVFECSPAAL